MNAVKATLEVREESVLHGDHHIVQTLPLAPGQTNLHRGTALYLDGSSYRGVPAGNPGNEPVKAVLLINVENTDDTQEAPCAVHGAVRGDKVCFADGSPCTASLREALRVYGIYVLGPIAITAQIPVLVQDVGDVSVDTGEEAELIFGVKINDGGDLSYQWYSNTSAAAAGGTKIAGATSASYKPSLSAPGAAYYYCVATNTLGDSSAVRTSSVSTVVVSAASAAAPAITTQPADVSVAVGATAALSVAASVTDGGTLSYQWYSNVSESSEGGTAVSGATSASYNAPTAAAGTHYYYCVVTNTLGGHTAATTTAAATVTVTA